MIYNSKSNKILLVNCLKKCVELSRNKCWSVVFSINFLYFPKSHCNSNGSLWPRLWHFDMGSFTLVLKWPIFHFSQFFSQNLTPAHLSIHTHIIMHTLSISDFGENDQRPKWLTLIIGRNDQPTKSETTHPLNSNETTQDKKTGLKRPAFRRNSLFNSPQDPINEALSKSN